MGDLSTEMSDLRNDLRELVDSAALLLDENTYTDISCRRLIEAVGAGKVALQSMQTEEEDLQEAYGRLCEAVDGLETRDEHRGKSARRQSGKTKRKDPSAARTGGAGNFNWRDVAPYVICGAAIAGSAAFLVSSLGKRKESKPLRKEHFWDRWIRK